jgi:hypothetical protein
MAIRKAKWPVTARRTPYDSKTGEAAGRGFGVSGFKVKMV